MTGITLPMPDVIMTWQFWIVAVACYVICEVVKRIPAIADGDKLSWLVNVVNAAAGIILMCLVFGWTGENVLFGILASSASTLAYEVWHNALAAIVGPKEG